jgi:hypothetical protein
LEDGGFLKLLDDSGIKMYTWKEKNVKFLSLLNRSELNTDENCTIKLNKIQAPIFINKMVELGENLGIFCPLCVPGNTIRLFWYNYDHFSNTIQRIESENDNYRVFVNQNILFIRNFYHDDINIYFCISEENSRPKFLISDEIVRFNLILRPKKSSPIFISNHSELQVLPGKTMNLSKIEEHKMHEFFDSKSGIMSYISWSNWSICENCDAYSVRHRIGQCKMIYKEGNKISIYLNEINRTFISNGGWSCSLNIHSKYQSLENFRGHFSDDYVEFDKCFVKCDLNESEQFNIVRYVFIKKKIKSFFKG